MAYIATYISTTAASELSTFYQDASRLDTTTHEAVIKESYDYLNSMLDVSLPVPITKEQTTARYPAKVRLAQALCAIWYIKTRQFGSNHDQTRAAKEYMDKEIQDLVNLAAHLERMTSADEVGIQAAVPASTNTSTGIIEVDRGQTFIGSVTERYLITITTAGAIGTAIYKWKDGEGNETTAVTSHFGFRALEKGLYIRFGIDSTVNFALNDTWTITCVPESALVTPSAGSFSQITARK